MAKVTFPYTELSRRSGETYPSVSKILRPLAFATVTASNGEFMRCAVLVDSGADACLFPLNLAVVLKLDLLSLPRSITGGVGSQGNVTYHDTVRIDLGEGIAFQTLVGFTQGLDAVGMGLLGQAGFFESYNVEFLHRQKIFTVERF